MGRFKKMGEIGTIIYGAYKWAEEHADDLESGCDRVLHHSTGTKYEKFVAPPASLVRRGARWLGRQGEGGKAKA
jgi:hypothetical protein